MLHKFKLKPREMKKEAFYASDVGKAILDLYYAFQKVEPTNPMEWNVMARMGAGKGAEEEMLTVFKYSGIVDEDYDQEKDGYIDIEREGVPIHGYMDAVTKDGYPIEIKTINNKNSFDIARYKDGKPRENYVGQLAIYMDALGVDTGYLFVISLDGLNYWWIECKKRTDGKYVCGKTVVDIDKEYKRWSRLYEQNIKKNVEPDCWEYVYKMDVKEVNWSSLSNDKISKARNNKAVIGGEDSWKITYSPYKDKIIERQGVELGYTDKELEFIKDVTKGYSAKKK